MKEYTINLTLQATQIIKTDMDLSFMATDKNFAKELAEQIKAENNLDDVEIKNIKVFIRDM